MDEGGLNLLSEDLGRLNRGTCPVGRHHPKRHACWEGPLNKRGNFGHTMAKKAHKKVNRPKGPTRKAAGAKKVGDKVKVLRPHQQDGEVRIIKKKGQSGKAQAAKTPSGKAPSGPVPAGGVEPPKRKLGIRGAAPWAARHAAKHAAEARARAAEPPPPGSARATIRVPSGAEEIKAKIVALHNSLSEIKGLRKSLSRSFYDIGLVLQEIQLQRLYEARGFGTFETFVDREVDLGKTTSLRLIRIVEIFKKEASLEYGMDRMIAALSALDGQEKPAPMPLAAAASGMKAPLPLRPPQPFKK